MLQIIQHQKTGAIIVDELPAPQCLPGGVLVQTKYSLISAGTERTSVENAQSTLLARARKQPDEVRQVLQSVRKDGMIRTAKRVLNKLDSYKPLGYSIAGIVVETDTEAFAVGDRVACAGNQYAYHAEMITAPKNLVVRIPQNVTFEDAAYTTLGAIAMQGVRQSEAHLGETVAVIGLGLLGQISVQLLKAAGCRVIGLDIDDSLFDTARALGCDAVYPSTPAATASIKSFTRGIGVDSVLITAGTSSNQPLELSIDIARRKGKIVVVGAVGMNVPRPQFYTKELDLRISCSYGPGRYDPMYEEHGVDYPPGYVRWTENRNMQAFLDLISMGKVDVHSMTTHRFKVEDAEQAYDLISGKKDDKYLGIVLEYPQREDPKSSFRATARTHQPQAILSLGFIGAGSFAQSNLLPYLQESDLRFEIVSTANPANAKSVADRFKFGAYTTDSTSIIENPDVSLIFCASKHDSHARYVVAALRNGKPIFVEKPLAVTLDELLTIDKVVADTGERVMVGFNRRFSEPIRKIKRFFSGRNDPIAMTYRVNAGAIPASHWIQDTAQGGRIIGEGCHFIDCMVYVTGALPKRVYTQTAMGDNSNLHLRDTVQIMISFTDGSIGTIHYLANGDGAVPKEYCEVFCEGKTAFMDNFKSVKLAHGGRLNAYSFNGDKGHRAEVVETVQAIRNGSPMPITYPEIRAVTLASFAAVESLRDGFPIDIEL